MLQEIRRIPDSNGQSVRYFARVLCSHCKSPQKNGEHIKIAQLWGEDSESALREALLNVGPWICRSCGISFYLIWASIDAVVAVQIRARIVENVIRSDEVLNDMTEASLDAAQRGGIFIPVEELRRRKPNV